MALKCRHRRPGHEGQVGEADASCRHLVSQLCPRVDHGAEVDLGDCCAVRRGPTALDHVARDRLTHRAHRLTAAVRLGPRPRPWLRHVGRLAVKRPLCGGPGGSAALDVSEQVGLLDPPADAVALDPLQVDVVLFRDAAHDRRVEARAVGLAGAGGRLGRVAVPVSLFLAVDLAGRRPVVDLGQGGSHRDGLPGLDQDSLEPARRG